MPNISLPAVAKWTTAYIVAQWLSVPDSSRTILTVLMSLMALDYITGVSAAYVTKQLSSEIGGSGLIKKGLILCLILCAHLMEKLAGVELHLEVAGALGFAVNEGISVVENCAKAGIWVPAGLVEALIAVQHIKGQRATADQLARLRGDVVATQQEAIEKQKILDQALNQKEAEEIKKGII